jgi:ribosomal protein S28E/S33
MKYIKKYENQKMSSLKMPSDKEIEDAEKYLEEGKDPNWDYKFGYFYIDVSGKYSVYYTLWKDSPLNTNFITNLSTDFQTAVEKAKKISGRIPVIIDRTGTKAGLFKAAKAEILTFGKYRGKTLGDVFAENPQYIVWLYKNYKGKSQERYERIKYYNDLYFETITKKNQETDKSEYVGKVGDKITFEADVYDVKITDFISKRMGNKRNLKCKLIDKDGNKYLTFNIGGKVEKGDTIKISARVKDHREMLGVKFTIINYCKIIWNQREDINKFNL